MSRYQPIALLAALFAVGCSNDDRPDETQCGPESLIAYEGAACLISSAHGMSGNSASTFQTVGTTPPIPRHGWSAPSSSRTNDQVRTPQPSPPLRS